MIWPSPKNSMSAAKNRFLMAALACQWQVPHQFSTFTYLQPLCLSYNFVYGSRRLTTAQVFVVRLFEFVCESFFFPWNKQWVFRRPFPPPFPWFHPFFSSTHTFQLKSIITKYKQTMKTIKAISPLHLRIKYNVH